MARDYLSEYKGHCLTCKNYDIHSKVDATVRGFRCINHHRPMAMDEKCPSYGLDYTRSNYQIDEAVEWIGRRGYEPRRDSESCYVTTIICNILGMPDNCEYLTWFRKLRDEYMVNSEFGLRLLYAYDTYGVQISEALENMYNDPKTREYVQNIINYIIVPQYLNKILDNIKNGHYDIAVNEYILMSMRLGNVVGVSFQIPEVDVDTLDKTTVGHGRRLVNNY